MRRSFSTALAVAITACACASFAPGASSGALANPRAKQVCAAGSVRWLERWDRAYIGRVLTPSQVFRVAGAQPFMRLELADSYGFPTVVSIVAERLNSRCRATWFRARVQSFPNGTLGWIRASALQTSRVRKRIVVDVSQHRLTLYDRGRVALSTPAAVGKSGTPTPLGHFYITQRFILENPNGPYGARALGISAYSNVLRSWADGGPIGIHGTNEPFSIGQSVSHGCVRLPERAIVQLFGQVPLGTPVTIRA